ncbi:MAG: hypothetical protein WD118_09285 [Phycisphaeraceae bacterium]
MSDLRLLVRNGRLVTRSGKLVTVQPGQTGDCECCQHACDCNGIDWENTAVELRGESYSYQPSDQTISTPEADCSWKPAGTLQSGPNVTSETYTFHSRTADEVRFVREDEWGEHFIRWNCLLHRWEQYWGSGIWEEIYHFLAIEPEVEVGYAPGHPEHGQSFACEAWHSTYPGYDKCATAR